MSEPILITGSGIVSAIGNDKAETLDALRKQRTGIGAVHYLETSHTEFPVGEVKLSNDEMKERLGLDLTSTISRTTLMGALAIRQALQEAGIKADATQRIVLISGTTVGGMDVTEQHFLDMLEHDAHLDLLARHDCGSTTEEMARLCSLQSEHCYTISTACSSAANAIILGANLLKTNEADIVIAGGSESLSRFHLNGFNTLMILDREQCRPFDETRAGLNLGEGAAFVVLERESDAQQRGAKGVATLAGYGNACDAFHQTATSPEGEGAYRAMSEALATAGLQPSEIQYVNAHGTGTPNNDQCEAVALKRVYGDALPPISSTKSFTGHTTSASGSIETVICLLALQEQMIPGNIGWKTPMTDGILPTLGVEKASLQHVMCNSFGFGGNDSSLVLSLTSEAQDETYQADLPIYVRSCYRVGYEDGPVDVSAFIPKLEARRMSKLLKTAVYTSLTALQEAALDCPDAIISATSLGMLENSEKFLLQMCQEGEELLKPTLFMQSTHNTISGQLAIRTHCHGYNTTYTQGARSLQCALHDAVLQLRLGKVKTVLVGYHDECTELYAKLLERADSEQHPVGVNSVAMVLTTDPKDARYELKDWSLCGE